MTELLRLAWRNMWRNWRRTTIALVAIVIGLMMLLLFDGLLEGSDQTIFGNAVRLYGGNVMVHAPGYREKASRLPLLPLADPAAVLAAARAQPEVVAAGERINTGGVVSNKGANKPVQITAVQPDIEKAVSIVAENIADGRYLLAEDKDAIVIGKGLADFLKVGVGDKVNLLGTSANQAQRQHTMTVVGIFNLGMPEAEQGLVLITLPEAQTLYGLRDKATEVNIALRQIGGEAAVIGPLQAALPNYEIDSWKTLNPQLEQVVQTKQGFTTFIGYVVVFIACIGILNLMLMAVFERTREMGVLAALGMKGRQVSMLFLLEGTLIGVLGALIGCILGLALVGLVGRVGIDISSFGGSGMQIVALMGGRMYPSVTLSGVLARGITIVVLAALASAYPAWLASRRQPAEVLHHI